MNLLICVWAVSRHLVKSIVDKKWFFFGYFKAASGSFLCLQGKELDRRVPWVKTLDKTTVVKPVTGLVEGPFVW